MARDDTPVFATLRDALERRTVDELKKLLALLPVADKPKRKGEIADVIAEYLQGDGLHTLWKRLDSTQQSAVAETLYAADGEFDAVRFAAKYGARPDWGTVRTTGRYDEVPSLLQLFIIVYLRSGYPGRFAGAIERVRASARPDRAGNNAGRPNSAEHPAAVGMVGPADKRADL